MIPTSRLAAHLDDYHMGSTPLAAAARLGIALEAIACTDLLLPANWQVPQKFTPLEFNNINGVFIAFDSDCIYKVRCPFGKYWHTTHVSGIDTELPRQSSFEQAVIRCEQHRRTLVYRAAVNWYATPAMTFGA